MLSTRYASPRRRVIIAGVTGCTLMCAATAQAATPVETLQAAVPVAAYDGTAMWSRLDAATGKYQLVQAIDGGAPTVVAVPERDGAFDVDLGSSRGASTYAVYSRGGDLYRLDPRTAVEAKLTGLSSPRHGRARSDDRTWAHRVPTSSGRQGRAADRRHDLRCEGHPPVAEGEARSRASSSASRRSPTSTAPATSSASTYATSPPAATMSSTRRDPVAQASRW